MVALIVLRYTKPKAPRPYKVRCTLHLENVYGNNTTLACLPAGMQVPIVIPVIVLLISVYLVIGPIVDEPKVEYLYATLFILAGFIFYVPFVYYKMVMPGMSKYRPISSG
jgi:solute carrier family 7 (L-type amino acid transporter), member 9/15